MSNLRQRLLQVGGQIFHVFQPEGDADEVIDHAEGLAILDRIVEERHHGHLGDEAFRAAQAGRDDKELQRIDEAPRGLVVAPDQESDDAAKPAQVLFREAMIRV